MIMDLRVQTVVKLLEENLRQEVPPEKLARSVNLSPSHLRHLFKAETGLTLPQYLKSLRMRRARQLLETTFLNVKQIMSRIGVRDKSHFAHDFKGTYGKTPTQYRISSAGMQPPKNKSLRRIDSSAPK